ncbi:MAG: Gfo/Idh/MocA family oxidoreductase [Lentisphaerae bacterium]|nr:Gfo/Idh/MocA family oxidoreductase [Lentisphaerota bacterium]MCP4103455.1 Gfo/Idh/MocA family oxidoreductase [Lentisphaerota bacterium]
MSNKIKVGIIGLGRAGMNMHLPELNKFPELFEITAGVDIDPEHCKIFNEKCEAKTYSDMDEMLKDANCDLVSIATRSPDHVKHAKKLLKTGKYVFLEKPIALNYAEAKELAEASKKYPGKLFLRHNRRFERPFNHIKEIIASGILGDVYEIKLHRHGYQRRCDWQTLIECGGGQLNNWGPHIVDHALRFLESPVKEIWSDLKKIAAVGDAEDHLKVILKGENNRIVDFEISDGTALSQPEYIVFGTKGALTSDGKTIKMKYIDPEFVLPEIKPDPGTPSLDGGIANCYEDLSKVEWIEKEIDVTPSCDCYMRTIWEKIYESIRNGAEFPVTIEQGLEVVRVTEIVKKNSEFCS